MPVVPNPVTSRELLPQGAEVLDNGVRYRVWAPGKRNVQVEVFRGARCRIIPLMLDAGGYHHAIDDDGQAGDLYQYRLNGKGPFPDPASRWQPEGVHGKSEVIDPCKYEWSDIAWQRPRFRDLVIYELHIGAFTPEGTFRAAIGKLSYLHKLGVTAIQLMPVGDFPGDRNWGYDGVSLFAPARCYGTPDDFRAFVDAAHEHGIAVFLDVVYNHFGPDGNYLGQFSAHYFTKKQKTPWGDGVNFDGRYRTAVRSLFVSNAVYWIREFHIDGLRVDATHAIRDGMPRHILEEIADAVHACGGYVIAEDNRNLAKISACKPSGHGYDAEYADDFCHTVQVALGDNRFGDEFVGSAAEIADELQNGWYYRGQSSGRTGESRGCECAHLPPERFLFSVSNHDQVGNRALGERLHQLATAEAYRAASALLLLAPYTPLIFMGQEWGASSPFLYFTDHNRELGRLIEEGRRHEFALDPEFAGPEAARRIPNPQNLECFEKSKLNWDELQDGQHATLFALYWEFLRLRASVPVFRPETRENWQVKNLGVVALRYCGDECDWLVLVDLAGGHRISLREEEFCRTANGNNWIPVLSSNEKKFGGDGSGSFDKRSKILVFSQPEALVLKGTP